MANNEKVTIESLLSQIDRIVLLLAVAVFVASIAIFSVFDLSVHSSIWRDLVLALTSNVASSVLIYSAVFISLSRVMETRRKVEIQDLVDEVTAGLSSKQTLQLAAENITVAEGIGSSKKEAP
jgi:hypothetical protein